MPVASEVLFCIPSDDGTPDTYHFNYSEYRHYGPLPLPIYVGEDPKSGYIDIGFVSVLPKDLGTVVKTSCYGEVIYNNLFVKPPKFSLGVVRRDKDYDTYVWNPRFEPITLQTLKYYSVSGCQLETGILPQSFNPTEEKNYILHVSNIGSAVINGYILLDFDIFDYYLYITGLRLAVVPALCKALSFNVSYGFTNVKARTQKQFEERRPLVDAVKRKINVTVLVDTVWSLASLENMVRVSMDKAFAVAIVPEVMTVSDRENLQGAMSITVDQNIQNFFNLKHTNLIGFFNTETEIYEVNEISSIDFDNRIITLAYPILGDFPVAKTKIYPVVPCYLQRYNLTMIKSKIGQATLSFTEVQ